jgi:hypothetical protein
MLASLCITIVRGGAVAGVALAIFVACGAEEQATNEAGVRAGTTIAVGAGLASGSTIDRAPVASAAAEVVPRVTGGDAAAAAIARSSVAGLIDNPIRSISFVAAPPEETADGETVQTDRAWLDIRIERPTGSLTNTETVVDIELGVWKASLVLADTYRRLEEAGQPVAGGEIKFVGDESSFPGGTLRPNEAMKMYGDASGLREGAFRHDRDVAENEVRAAARLRGYTVDALTFMDVHALAPVLEVTHASVHQAIDAPEGYDDLFGFDFTQYDGVFLVVRDQKGEIALVRSFAAGTGSTGAATDDLLEQAEG